MTRGACDCRYAGAADPRDHHPRCDWVRWLQEHRMFVAQVIAAEKAA